MLSVFQERLTKYVIQCLANILTYLVLTEHDLIRTRKDKERLKILDFLPITYWHEYLDLVYLFKCVISNSDPNISIKASVRQTRSNTNNGILLNVAKCRTVSYQTSFYIRSAKVWNNLPCCIRDITKSLVSCKRALFMYYKDLTKTIYDPDDPNSFKSVCVKCHVSHPRTNLSKRLCC